MAKKEKNKEEQKKGKSKPGLFTKLKTGVRNLVTEPIQKPDEDEVDSGIDADSDLGDSVGDAAEAAPAVAMSTEEFESELQDLIDSHGNVLAGKMQFVDLSDTKSKYPERWEEIAEPLHALAASVIGMNLAQEDVYTRLEDSHIIVFSDLTEPEAKERCVRITKEISDLLVEQGVDSSIVAAKSVVGQVDGRAAIEDLDVMASSIPKVSAKTTRPRSK